MYRSISFVVLLSLHLFSQQQAKLMSYNILNYDTDTGRNIHLRTVVDAADPDVLVVQEMISAGGVSNFLNNVLNYSGTDYSAGIFVDGADTDNAIFYKHSRFSFVSNTAISTSLRDINEFKIVYAATQDTFRVYSAHLKASTGTQNQQQRLAEVNQLRQVTDNLPAASDFIVLGDFNIYTSTEPAYQALLNQAASGYVLDPINTPGSWHDNATFAAIHTQSPRTRQFGGGANGGMDDRFDMILISQGISNPGGIDYLNNSYLAYGNDGAHFNDSINALPNTAVPAAVANALHYGSDHIPVILTLMFEEPAAITADVKVFLQGPFNSGSMQTTLRDNNLLPLNQPYTGSPWNYNGSESVAAIPSGVVDWVLVELRTAENASSKAAARAAFIKNNGKIVDLDGTAPLRFEVAPGNYYLVIYHRNHLPVMSVAAQSLSASSPAYDFTTAQSKAFGSNPMNHLGGGVYGMVSGDGDADRAVHEDDRESIWRPQNGTAWDYAKAGDFNLDGGINAVDLNLFWRSNNTRSSQVP